MRRVVILLCAGGALVIVTYWLMPTSPAREPSARAVQSTQASTEKVVTEIDAEVSKLDARSARVEPPDPANRDPFHFGAAPTPPPKPAVPLPALAPPAPKLPKLIAITSKDTQAGVVRTATFSIDNDVRLVHPGDQVAGFVVQTIADGYVELVDPSTGVAYRVR